MNTYNTNCRNTLSTYINNVDCPITAKQWLTDIRDKI
jgi:hypothetical protein